MIVLASEGGGPQGSGWSVVCKVRSRQSGQPSVNILLQAFREVRPGQDIALSTSLTGNSNLRPPAHASHCSVPGKGHICPGPFGIAKERFFGEALVETRYVLSGHSAWRYLLYRQPA